MHRISVSPLFSLPLPALDISDLRYGAFLTAILIYAAFGSPTPDNPGWAEALVGGLLMLAAGFGGIARILCKSGQPFWFAAGRVLLLFGAVPLCMAVLRGHEMAQAARDIIPFLFLLLPLFLHDLIARKPAYASYLVAVVLCAGLIFALRSVGVEIVFVLFGGESEKFYFANAPTVLFAALFLCGLAGRQLLRGFRPKSLLLAGVCGVLALLPLAAMALVAQRASLGAAGVVILLLAGIAFYRRPADSLLLLMILCASLWAIFPVLADIGDLLLRKTLDVGGNMRLQEAAMAWQAIAAQPGTLLFGLGWGGSFQSPAVGGLSVNFTHGLLTSMLLKTGICGLILTLFYLGGLAQWLVRLVFRDPVAGFALAAPILIDVFLYASFKSLDFGLMLLLIPALLIFLRHRAQASIDDRPAGQGQI